MNIVVSVGKKLYQSRTCKVIVVFLLLLCVGTLYGCTFSKQNKEPLQEKVEDKGEPIRVERKKREEVVEPTNEQEVVEGPIGELLSQIESTPYQRSDFEQEDIDSDTVLWLCGTYAVFNQVNRKDLDLVGGMVHPADETLQEALVNKIRLELIQGWDIVDRQSAVDVIRRLMNHGHREKYMIMAEDLLTTNEMDADLKEKYPTDDPQTNELLAVQAAYQKFGTHGLDGWDYSRINQVLGDCYYAEYINMEECLEISLEVSKIIQSTFTSWDELGESYLFGHQFLRKDNPEDETTETGKRWIAFDELKTMEFSPYNLPFDMELVSSWSGNAGQGDALTTPTEGMQVLYSPLNEYSVNIVAPSGFIEDEYSMDTNRQFQNIAKDFDVSYRLESHRDKDRVSSSINIVKNVYQDDRTVVEENHIESANEIQSWVVTDHTMLGEDYRTFVFFSVKKGRENWLSLEAILVTPQSANMTKDEAWSICFDGVEWN